MGSPRDLIEGRAGNKQQRKYEVDEVEVDVRSRVGVAIAAVLGSVFVLLKEVFYSSAEASEDRQPEARRDQSGWQVSDESLSDQADETLSWSGGKPDQGWDLPGVLDHGSSTGNSLFFSRAQSFEIPGLTGRGDDGAGPYSITELQQAENDNLNAGQAEIHAPIPTDFLNFNAASAPASAAGAPSAPPPRVTVDGDRVVVDENGIEIPDLPLDEEEDVDYEEPLPFPTERVNRAPTVGAPVLLDGLLVNQIAIIAASQLLLGAADPDGDTLYVKEVSVSAGSVAALDDGNWHYQPTHGYVGAVSFTYSVSDGDAKTLQTASLQVSDVPGVVLEGTSQDDTLIGTPGADIISGHAGSDRILARDGDDIVYAGSQNDEVIGGAGDDALYGGDGDDLILAGDGDDVVFAGAGDDVVFGEEGGDTIFGEAGNDRLNGGDGNDLIDGGSGDDEIWGEAGDDILDGGSDNDFIDGGEGADTIVGGQGFDNSLGGVGDDRFVALLYDGDDIYQGDEGFDTYDLARTSAGAEVDLSLGIATSTQTGIDQLYGIEAVIGSGGDDTITGDENINSLDGRAGADDIDAGAGNDVIYGGAGEDVVHAGEGDDIVFAEAGDDDDSYFGDEGVDTYDLSMTSSNAVVDLARGVAESSDIGYDLLSGFEGVTGGLGGDSIIGDAGRNDLRGGDGSDLIQGEGGDDRLRGNDGDDIIDGGAGEDRIDGDDGDDILAGGDGSDSVRGGDGDDLFVASYDDGDDDYRGDDGIDTYDLSQTSADAVVDLGAGTAVSVDIGQDQIRDFENVIGGSGNDVFFASNAVNVFYGGEGTDTFTFRTAAEASAGHGKWDKIKDFAIGDKIDLSFIDANNEQEGNQSFAFVLDSNATARAGDLVMRYDFAEDDQNEVNTIIAGFANDDQLPNFEILVSGRHNLSSADFIGVHTAMVA